MGKLLTVVAITAGFIAVTVATGGVAAGFIGAASVSASGLAISVGIGLNYIAAAALAGALVGGALVGLQALIAPKVPNVNNEVGGGARLTKTLVPEEFRKICFGETAGAADIRYWETWDEDNKRFDEVVAVATHEIESFGTLHLDDELITFSGVNATGRLAGNLTRHTIPVGGGSVGPALGAAGVLWNPQGAANTKMTGLAYYVLRWLWDQEKFPRGFPNRVTQVVKGALVYDPRLDSTRGGTGLHRTDDQTTWQYNDGIDDIGRNPALQVLWYLLGWRINGVLVAGWGIDPDDIDFASFIVAANDCDSESYFSDVVLSTAQDHTVNVGIIEAAAAAKVLDTGGRFSMHIGTDDTAIVAAAFDDDDVVGAFQWVPKINMKAQYNKVVGQFVDPNALYQLRSYPDVEDAAFVSSDGFERELELPLIAVQSASQAQKIGRIFLNRSRFQGLFRAAFSYKAMLVKNWDIVTLSLTTFGWINEKFRVIGQDISSQGIIVLTLMQEDTAVYAAGTVNSPPTLGVGSAPDPSAKIAVVGATVAAIQVSSDGIASTDAIQLDWTVASPLVKRTDIQYKRASDSSWIPAATMGPGESQVIINLLDANTSYDVRIRHVTTLGVVGDWAVPTNSPLTTGRFTILEVGGTDADSAFNEGKTYIKNNSAVVGSRLEVADDPAWDLGASEAGTVEALVKVNAFTSPSAFVTKGYSGAGPGWGLRVSSAADLNVFTGDGTASNNIIHETKLVADKWYRVTFTRSATGLTKLYLDGVKAVNEFTINTDLSGALAMMIGARAGGTTDELDGSIRDVRFWNTERTQQEILDNLFTIFEGNEPGLIGLWRTDEGAGPTAFNLGSTSGGDATFITAGPSWGGSGVITVGTIEADKFVTDAGVGLPAIVPGSLSVARDETDTQSLTVLQSAPVEKFFNWTTAFTKSGHRIIIVVAELTIGRAGVPATLDPTGTVKLYRRVDGGAPTEIASQLLVHTTSPFVRTITTDQLDAPVDGVIEYRISFNNNGNPGTDDIDASNARINFEAPFFK